jgi:hypothetical protein
MQGATGEMIGTVTLTNITARICSLQGSPRLTIISADGHQITDRQQRYGFLQQLAYSRWHAYPVVSLRPSQHAIVPFRWRNCGHPALSSFRVTWHHATWIARIRQEAVCDPKARPPSNLEVRRFTPTWH